MAKLEEAVRRLDEVELKPPPPILEIGRRLRLIYESAMVENYVWLSRSELRKLPFAYWVEGYSSLEQTDPQLIQRYWDTLLPEALISSPRRAKRWLAPLFFVYCEKFDSQNTEFIRFSSRLLLALQQADGLFAQKLRQLQVDHLFFIPSDVALRLARLVFTNHNQKIESILHELLLWPGILSSGLGLSIFRSGLMLPSEQLRESQTVLRLMEWSLRLSAPVVKTDLRVMYADALLRPWSGRKPADSLKNSLIDYFLKEYGDPRFPGNRHYQWSGVSPQSLGVLLNWLTGDTLRAFMKLLQRTADEIWHYRQKFWMAYYEKGLIDEAWIALGEYAAWEASKLKLDEKGMGSGYLKGGATSNQSVLLLKMGGLVFTEWSHNGSLRAYRDGSADAPKLYQNSYQGVDLRRPTSLDFHDGMNMRPELIHAHSVKGSWQRKARDFIRRETGAYLSDVEIL